MPARRPETRGEAIPLPVSLAALAALAAAALLLAAPAPARADGLLISGSVGAEGYWHRAWDAVDSDDHLLGPRLSLGWWARAPGGAAELELAFGPSLANAPFHSMESELALYGLEAGLTWRFALARFFQPFVRASVGYDWATLTLDDGRGYGGAELEQTTGNFAFSGLAGFTFPVVARLGADGRWVPRVSFDVSAGYVARPDYVFDALLPPEDDDAEPRASRVVALNLGKLPLSGLRYRVGLTARF